MTKTVAELIDEINTQLPTNNSRAISAAVLRPVLIDMVSNNQITLVGGNTAILAETRSFAQGTSFPAIVDGGPTHVLTAGFAVVGDGGDGMYVRLGSDPGSANPGYFQSLDGAWWALVAVELHVEQFGGQGDYNPDLATGTDNLAAMNAAIQYITILPQTALLLFYKSGAKIVLGYGKYYFSDAIVPDRTVVIEGSGNALNNDGFQTTCYVAAGKSFAIISGYLAPTPGAAFTTLRNLPVLSNGDGGQTTAHGVQANCQVKIENCQFFRFGGDGIHIVGDAGTSPGFNANLSQVINCWATANVGHGIFLQGGDANACYIESFSAVSNGGWGVFDDSFLGNTFIMCHVADNGLGSYKCTQPNSGTCFIGCYVEGGEANPVINSPATVFGGPLALSFNLGSAITIGGTVITPFSVGRNVTDLGTLHLGIRQGANALFTLNAPSATYLINHPGGYPAGTSVLAVASGTVTIGVGNVIYITGDKTSYAISAGTTGPGNITIVPVLQQDVVNNQTIAIQGFATDPMDFRWDTNTNTWAWQYNNSVTFGPLLTTELSTGPTCGRSTTIPVASSIFPTGVFVGAPGGVFVPSATRFLGFGTAIPISGTFAQGDRIFDSAAVAGGTEGWVCVTGGSPGTWKTFGSIAV